MSATSSFPNSPIESHDAVILPNIRTSKRRVVANSNRKRALFSCDRCKVKKIACQRISEAGMLHDSKTPCIHCKKLNLDCKTTIMRKKRVHGPIENIGLHYKCLITILKGLYPDRDINNIDTLIVLGENLHLKMPSRDGITKEEEEDLKDIAILLTSKDDEDDLVRDDLETEDQKKALKPIQHKEVPQLLNTDTKAADSKNDGRLIVDHGGNTHYIGPLGAPAMATTVFAILLRNASDKVTLRSNLRNQRDTKREGIINSKQVPLNSYMFRSLDLENFPLLNLLNRTELDYYYNVFLNKLHPLVFFYDKLEFASMYETFWSMLANTTNHKLSNPQICCIYMVWILGRLISPYSDAPESLGVMQFDDNMVSRYIDVTKITLSEILLTPSLDGIRCIILLSIYMDNNKRRESGYVLIELLARQAISIGLNRKSLLTHIKNDSQIELMKRTWWVLFKHELKFSNQMGRPTCLQIEDINVGPPSFDDPTFELYVHEEIKLNKIMYGLLQYRKKLFLNYELLSLVNMEKLINLKTQFNRWLKELPALLDYEKDPTLYKCALHFEYNYYFITLSLPFVLYSSVHNNLKLSKDDPILDMICQCVSASINIAKLMAFTDSHGFTNGTIYSDWFLCYHATMAFVLFYLLLLKDKRLDLDHIEKTYGISAAVIEDCLKLIKMMVNKNKHTLQGSLMTIGELVELMITDLEVIVQLKNPSSGLLSPPQDGENQQFPHGNLQAMELQLQTQQQLRGSPLVYQDPLLVNGDTVLSNTLNSDFTFNFGIDNQVMLDNDMIDLLFGGDLLAMYGSSVNPAGI